MRESLLAAVTAAAILSAGALADSVEAMTFVTPSARGAANSGAAPVRQAAVVCGSNGCVRVQTSRVQRHPPPRR